MTPPDTSPGSEITSNFLKIKLGLLVGRGGSSLATETLPILFNR
jgi:hypothetical protein